MTPTELDDIVFTLEQRMTRLGTAVPEAEFNAISAVIVKWGEFYQGNYERWDVTQMPAWESEINAIGAALDAAETAHGSADEYAEPESGDVRKTFDPHAVFGWRILGRPWWHYAAAAGAATVIYRTVSK